MRQFLQVKDGQARAGPCHGHQRHVISIGAEPEAEGAKARRIWDRADIACHGGDHLRRYPAPIEGKFGQGTGEIPRIGRGVLHRDQVVPAVGDVQLSPRAAVVFGDGILRLVMMAGLGRQEKSPTVQPS